MFILTTNWQQSEETDETDPRKRTKLDKLALSFQGMGEEDDTIMGTTDLLQLQIIAIQSQRQEKQRLLDLIRRLQQEVKTLREEMEGSSQQHQSFVKEVILRRAIHAKEKLDVFVATVEQTSLVVTDPTNM